MHKIYLLDVIGAIGDSLCSEPVLRYAIRNLPNADIRIQTNHPRLFKHLNKPMGISLEELGIDLADPNVEVIHLFNRHEMITVDGPMLHPIVNFAPPWFVHPVDFISLMMLRRIMPDDDKKIHSEFTDTTEALEQMIGEKLEDLTLLHVGTGAPEKTRLFPDEYCSNLIEEMLAKGLKVATIATTDHRSHCTKVKSNAIDLVNKLDWNGFCTVVSKAKVLVTNDSSPVHIASMFDNWLIVMPTVKHPDRLIHPRQGHRYHKCIALYQRLLCEDSVEIPIDSYVTHYNWDGVENFREFFLPDPKVVAQHAKLAASGCRDLIGGINPYLGDSHAYF